MSEIGCASWSSPAIEVMMEGAATCGVLACSDELVSLLVFVVVVVVCRPGRRVLVSS